MENEIKVNEYIRTIQGYIAKVEDIDNDFIYCDEMAFINYDEMPMLPIENKNFIVKHSFNLIDIIEERRLCKWRKS